MKGGDLEGAHGGLLAVKTSGGGALRACSGRLQGAANVQARTCMAGSGEGGGRDCPSGPGRGQGLGRGRPGGGWRELIGPAVRRL